MKNSKIYISIVAVTFVLVLTSCKKDFLDKTPYNATGFENAIETETDLVLAVNGIYASLRTSDMYGRTLPMMGDIMADNVYIANVNTGRYLAFNNYVILSNNGEADEIWSAAYSTILRANQAINSPVPENSNVKQLKGEAYALRALMYFELIRVFARPYSAGTINDAGVPLVLTYDPNAQPPRNTIGAVYDQIVSDFQTSVSLMTVSKNSQYISTWAAKAMLAKVYQYMGDWTNAANLASDFVTNSGYKLTDSSGYVAYWKNPAATTKSETIFEVSIDGVDNNGVDALANMYMQQGYGDALCDSNLYNLYATSDVRFLLLSKGSHHGQSAYIVRKYSNMSNPADKDDIKVLRVSEIFLLLAEAKYNMGDEPNARNYLDTIAKKRDPSFTGYTSTGPALLEDIITERRKELAFEGNRYFDITRLHRDVNRGLPFPATAQFIPYADHRRILPIPQVEMDANPNITQNPGY